MIKFYTALIICILNCLTNVVKANDTTLTGKKDSGSINSKICSCQLYEIKESRFDTKLVGFFAEKTQEGKRLNNFKVMNEYIWREKIYFEIVFVKSAELKERINSATDCISLYNKLKLAYKDLKLYNIIQVDALKGIASL